MANNVSALASIPQAVRTAVQDLARRLGALPKGAVAVGTVPDANVTMSATPEPLSSAVKVSTKRDRLYEVRWGCRAFEGAGTAITYLVRDGVSVAYADTYHRTDGAYHHGEARWVFRGTGETNTFQVMGVLSSGAARFHMQVGPSSFFYVADLGKVAA